jgi:hypothetical protein
MTRHVIVECPAAPPPDDPFVQDIADALWRIEGNYNREGSGPGSRFEGLTLERAQAEFVIREVRRHDRNQGAAT